MIIEANTLEEAYEKAAKMLNCSVADIEAKVIQYPSKGIFGLFSKKAIIEVDERLSIEKVIEKVKEELKRLFEKSCYKVEIKEVSKYDEDTIFIHIDGEDTPLLIGKDGYRFNALNYFLYNYVTQKYGFKVRVEVGEFIKNQTEKLKEYLDFFIKEKINTKGYGKTKALRGVLPYLAVEILREKLPNKYVAIREKNGEKYIIVGDKNGHNSSDSNT